MPRTARRTASSGLAACASAKVRDLRPPGNPEWRYTIFLSALSEVRTTFSALMMITWSPMSMCGAKVGLCLPRRMRAASVERRPSTRSSASITNHLRVISLALGL